MRRLSVFSMATLVAMSTSASAQDRPHTHDGFFLRLAGGPGYSRSTVKYQGADLETTGGGAALSVAIGGSVVEDLAIHAELFGVSAVAPTVSQNGTRIGSGSREDSLSSVGIGAGLTYYFSPTNLYLSAAFGMGRVALRANGDEVHSDTGIGLDFLLGKEWWVSENWGLGLAGQLIFTSVPSSGDTDFHTVGLGLLLSASYN